MNKLFLVIAILLIGCAAEQLPEKTTVVVVKKETPKEIVWQPFSDNLINIAQNENKKIFIFLSSDNCAFCKSMEMYTFTNETVIDIMGKGFVATTLDVEKDNEVASLFYVDENITVPKMIFMLPKKDKWIIAEVQGYIDAYQMIRLLNKVNDLFERTETEGFGEPNRVPSE